MKSVTFFLLVASLSIVTIAYENSERVDCGVLRRSMIDYCINLIDLGIIDTNVEKELEGMEMKDLFSLIFVALEMLIKHHPEMEEDVKESIEYFKEQEKVCGH